MPLVPKSEYHICSRCGYPVHIHTSTKGRKICPEVSSRKGASGGSGRAQRLDDSPFKLCSKCGLSLNIHNVKNGLKLCPEIGSS